MDNNCTSFELKIAKIDIIHLLLDKIYQAFTINIPTVAIRQFTPTQIACLMESVWSDLKQKTIHTANELQSLCGSTCFAHQLTIKQEGIYAITARELAQEHDKIQGIKE